MKTLEFLAELNNAEKGLGLWLNRNNPEEYHLGHYAYDNDRMPKDFVHVASIDELAHLRQKYINSHQNEPQSHKQLLGKEWADHFLDDWRSHLT